MSNLVIKTRIHLKRRGSRKRIFNGGKEESVGRLPRITKLMALALRYERLIREGHVKNHADLARLGGCTRAHINHVMGLLNLAPDIIEEILDMPRIYKGKDPIRPEGVYDIASEKLWDDQRKRWKELTCIRAYTSLP